MKLLINIILWHFSLTFEFIEKNIKSNFMNFFKRGFDYYNIYFSELLKTHQLMLNYNLKEN